MTPAGSTLPCRLLVSARCVQPEFVKGRVLLAALAAHAAGGGGRYEDALPSRVLALYFQQPPAGSSQAAQQRAICPVWALTIPALANGSRPWHECAALTLLHW